MIYKKREGKSLKISEINSVVKGLLEDDIPLYQVSAFLMAVYFQGLTDIELKALTTSIRDSGESLKFDIEKPIIDKHSTGGVGDKVSFIIGPICAGCGLAVPLSAGRTLGHTGGTIDKLESIPGVNTTLSEKKIENILRDIGFVIFGQSDEIAPADKILYSMRDATATVESIPLIVSSILGKKLTINTDAIVFDVKCGSGAFLPELTSARELAQTLVDMANKCSKTANALLTSNDEPLGKFVGNSLEIYEVIKILKGENTDERLKEVSLSVASLMLTSGVIVDDFNGGLELATETLDSGNTYEILSKMVVETGGDIAFLQNPERLRTTEKQTGIKAHRDGTITDINARMVGELVRRIGGGRYEMGDDVDHMVGIEFLRKEGGVVKRGDDIALVYHRDNIDDEEVRERFKDCLSIKEERYFPKKSVLSLYTGDGKWISL